MDKQGQLLDEKIAQVQGCGNQLHPLFDELVSTNYVSLPTLMMTPYMPNYLTIAGSLQRLGPGMSLEAGKA